tara:strand:- start:926 stop:2005 length:1080 start_codon:yes stop_codon:yes gene_type:complete
MELKNFLNLEPYSLNSVNKSKLLDKYFFRLTKYHYENCLGYKKILDSVKYDYRNQFNYSDIPFLPVRLFKMFDLYSVSKENIVKTMTSSGTSGQDVSKIFLNKETALNQSKVLAKIVSSYLGTKRVPMIIIDTPSVLKNRNMFSARGAGILGFSIFGAKRIYALDNDMKLNVKAIENFIKVNKNNRIFIFGFTFMIYQHFIKEIKKQKLKFDLSNSVLIHGGGWKKLINQSIKSSQFRKMLNRLCGIDSVYDYYGMVEQTGSIFMECELGNMHTSIFSDIIIRNPFDFSVSKIGEKGVIQTLSVLPKSYPGHSLLTDDEGVQLGEDDCGCGRLGKYFKIIGRVKSAELRGCSDTYAEQF